MRRPLPPIAARPEAKARRGPRTTLRLFHPAAARKRSACPHNRSRSAVSPRSNAAQAARKQSSAVIMAATPEAIRF